jgi:hypothetical protein
MSTDTLLLEEIRPHDDYHYRHDKHGKHRVLKHSLAQVPLASPGMAV